MNFDIQLKRDTLICENDHQDQQMTLHSKNLNQSFERISCMISISEYHNSSFEIARVTSKTRFEFIESRSQSHDLCKMAQKWVPRRKLESLHEIGRDGALCD
jgi:hypothetical protein